jgi:AcrR family transcriptional regulator
VNLGVKVARPYRTQLRQQQSQLTRQRILEAARTLLVREGYSQVTMQEVAQEAGVAYQTVYSQFGNKIRLAQELCDAGFPHVADALGLLAQGREAGDPEAWLRIMGTVARRIYEPCADLMRFMRESGDPELEGRFKQIEQGRFERLAELGPQLERSRRLQPGLSGAEAVDLVWVLAGPETYEQLVLDRNWSPERFEHWLSAALVDLVLAN